MTDMPPTPMLDKMSDITDDSQTIGEFLDWLPGEGLHLVRWEHNMTVTCTGFGATWTCGDGAKRGDWDGVSEGPCPYCNGTGEVTQTRAEPVAVPNNESIEQLLARYFDIDLNEVDRERKAVLDAIRAQP